MRNILRAKKVGYNNIFQDISYSFSSESVYTIFGKSGIGKSTFLKVLSRNALFQGEIFYNEQNVKEIPPQKYRITINYLPQEPVFNEENIIKDILSLKELAVNKNLPIDEAEVLDFGNMLGLDKDIFHKNISLLSGGEKQRGAIIRSLMLKPSFLLMDEPTSALDVYSQNLVMDLIDRIKKHIGIIMVSHSPEIITNGDIILFMDKNGFKEIDRQISPDEISRMIRWS